ncbi:PD40 domain-containing protein [Catellatospora citrea]|uniref:TolB-like translocation protein signal peptide n=1 Tax=Catellatospora citrea TaxID=53366 RepID=A0A8J3KJ12_9ACTN|nr:PD40 domain-containing protein [Catellatospora citrea]RKE12342.1 WD40 repeat protein [Catellatospora citrea]GIG00853.1 TolB-like translocation protein; signal peptide [Catellatospora citrea]
MTALSTRARVAIAAAVTVLLAAVAVGYIQLARGEAATADTAPAAEITLDPGPRLLVVADRRAATVSLADPSGPRLVSGLECVRVYAAAGTGVCIHPDTAWSYQLTVLDRQLRATRTFAVPGLPNRARVSASGRMVAWTTFVGGDSYSTGGFSTRTGILDTRTGTMASTLEDFAVTREGRTYRNVDMNFWGVTFTADDNAFYATMATGGKRYLVHGDFAARTLRTLTDNVECPSLSPDGTRIAFKQAIGGDPQRGWRLSVLDPSTMAVTNLAETQSVDDQAAWLDERTVAYTLRAPDGTPSIWSVPADGTGAPTKLLDGAESPAALG